MSYFEETKLKGEKGGNQGLILEELLESILKELKIMNLHLEIMTENQITEEEID